MRAKRQASVTCRRARDGMEICPARLLLAIGVFVDGDAIGFGEHDRIEQEQVAHGFTGVFRHGGQVFATDAVIGHFEVSTPQAACNCTSAMTKSIGWVASVLPIARAMAAMRAPATSAKRFQ